MPINTPIYMPINAPIYMPIYRHKVHYLSACCLPAVSLLISGRSDRMLIGC